MRPFSLDLTTLGVSLLAAYREATCDKMQFRRSTCVLLLRQVGTGPVEFFARSVREREYAWCVSSRLGNFS